MKIIFIQWCIQSKCVPIEKFKEPIDGQVFVTY